jgi:hypothetical protein
VARKRGKPSSLALWADSVLPIPLLSKVQAGIRSPALPVPPSGVALCKALVSPETGLSSGKVGNLGLPGSAGWLKEAGICYQVWVQLIWGTYYCHPFPRVTEKGSGRRGKPYSSQTSPSWLLSLVLAFLKRSHFLMLGLVHRTPGQY